MQRWRRFVLVLVVAASALVVGAYVHRLSAGSAVRASKAAPLVICTVTSLCAAS